MFQLIVDIPDFISGPINELEQGSDALLEEVLDTMAAAMLDRTRKRFLEQVSPDGVAWKESRAAMIRRVTGRDGGTLFDTGSLFHSLNVLPKRFGERVIGVVPGTVNRETGERVETYAVKHQLGVDRMEKRPFIGISQPDSEYLTDLADALIRRRLGQ